MFRMDGGADHSSSWSLEKFHEEKPWEEYECESEKDAAGVEHDVPTIFAWQDSTTTIVPTESARRRSLALPPRGFTTCYKLARRSIVTCHGNQQKKRVNARSAKRDPQDELCGNQSFLIRVSMYGKEQSRNLSKHGSSLAQTKVP